VRVSTPSARGASSASRIARTSGLRALSDRTVVVLRERIFFRAASADPAFFKWAMRKPVHIY
jgi:hypothetical protein